MSHQLEKIKEEIDRLPFTERGKLLEWMLSRSRPESLEGNEKEADRIAEQRALEVLNGEVEPVPADKVYEEARRKYGLTD